MRFKRFLAILLLLILPLQSTLAAIDLCCNDIVTQEAQDAKVSGAQIVDADSAAASITDDDCCARCNFCNHPSTGVLALKDADHRGGTTAPPFSRPELPIDSFIPDIPAPPDRA